MQICSASPVPHSSQIRTLSFPKIYSKQKEKQKTKNQTIFMQISTKHVSFFFLFFIEKKKRKQYANCLLIFKLYLSNHLIQRNFPYAFFLWTFFFEEKFDINTIGQIHLELKSHDFFFVCDWNAQPKVKKRLWNYCHFQVLVRLKLFSHPEVWCSFEVITHIFIVQKKKKYQSNQAFIC